MRGVTYAVMEKLRRLPFQLTRLMRGVTAFSGFQSLRHIISTHTPHARRDEGAKAE